jgi:hypothetical protein
VSLAAEIGDMQVRAVEGGVVLARKLKLVYLWAYAACGLVLGGLVYLSFADRAIAWLSHRPALAIGTVAALVVFAVSAYGGLAPRWITFFSDGAVRARGHDAFRWPPGGLAGLVVEWHVADRPLRGDPERTEPWLRGELLAFPKRELARTLGLEVEPFAEVQARLGSPETERLRAEVTAFLRELGERLGVPVEEHGPPT